jgi:hypothetical protein
MRVGSTGFVGIGTIIPNNFLDVAGAAEVVARFYRTDSTLALLRVGNSATLDGVQAPEFGSDGTNAVIHNANAERLRIASAGQIGIGGANYGTSGQALVSGGSGAAPSWSFPANLSTNNTNWSTNGTISAVVGQLAWKNYGNSHTIFDASQSTSPDGGAVNNTNATVAWAATYPTLMGWNGSQTYGVRVDSARVADSASSVTLLGTLTTTSGASQTLSGLSLGAYSFLVLSVQNVSVINTGRIDLNGIRVTNDVATTSGLSGLIQIDLATGVGIAMTGQMLVTGTPPLSSSTVGSYTFRGTLTNASTSITVASGNTFDSGSIRVYGVR